MTDTAPTSRPYHHGDLPAALLRAAEEILERDGIQGLTLRGVARAAGVSHAAPKNHFGDLTGLLSELAALGHRRFATAIGSGLAAGGPARQARLLAMGQAYVAFARAHPGMFALMYRSERLDARRPALRDAIALSRAALRDAGAANAAGTVLPPLLAMARAAAIWSLVHGFATLLLDGRLAGMIAALPPGETVDTLLEAVLVATSVGE